MIWYNTAIIIALSEEDKSMFVIFPLFQTIVFSEDMTSLC